MSANSRRRLFFLEKVFLKPRRAPVRGVELFNLNLLRDLAALAYRVVVPVHATWADTVRQHAGPNAQIMRCPPGGMPFVNALLAACQVRGPIEAGILGNVGNGLVPAIKLLATRRVTDRWVLLAHREPSPRFVRACTRLPLTVVAVNDKIAGHFSPDRFARVETWYGITDADRFHPPAPADTPTGPFKFCVLGQLDNAWKGADTAVAAFRLLPPDLRARCELHLASFARPPEFPEPAIHAHAWMPVDQIPDFLRGMHAMLVPSRDEGVMRETFSQAIVQGMLTGLPVCTTNLPILVEKLDAGGGLVADSPAHLAEHMQELATDPALCRRLGQAGRQTALSRYTWDTPAFADRYLSA